MFNSLTKIAFAVTALALFAATPAWAVDLGATTGTDVSGGRKVLAIPADSLAKDLGLKKGDVILTVNGGLVRTKTDYLTALDQVTDSIVLLLLRGGKVSLVEADFDLPGPGLDGGDPAAFKKPGFKGLKAPAGTLPAKGSSAKIRVKNLKTK